MGSPFLEKLWECNEFVDYHKCYHGWGGHFRCFLTDFDIEKYIPFTDHDITMIYPLLKGTPFGEPYEANLITYLEAKCLGELSLIPDFRNQYKNKIKRVSERLSKNIFKEHSLFLLKEHCKLFSPFHEECKVLLEKLEQIDCEKIEWDESSKIAERFTIQKEINLHRFMNAQDYGGIREDMSDYKTALHEIKNGRKETHWIWYIFPQMKGLGHSPTSDFYGIEDRAEAYAYMEHPILSSRLVEATEAVLNNKHSAYEIFGHDVIKFRSCMLLFSTVSDNPVFKQVLRKHSW